MIGDWQVPVTGGTEHLWVKQSDGYGPRIDLLQVESYEAVGPSPLHPSPGIVFAMKSGKQQMWKWVYNNTDEDADVVSRSLKSCSVAVREHMKRCDAALGLSAPSDSASGF